MSLVVQTCVDATDALARVLCQAYNVGQPLTQLDMGAEIPDTIDMEALYATQMPTHALVITDASGDDPPKSAPVVVPVDIFTFNATFKKDILRLPERTVTPLRNHATGVPYVDEDRNIYIVSLPTIAVYSSHPPSVPLLLLFALWDYLPSHPSPDPSRAPSPTPSLSSLVSSGSVPTPPPPTVH